MAFLARVDWEAKEPTRTPQLIPASQRRGIVGHWNGPPMKLNLNQSPEDLLKQEDKIVRALQNYHQSRWSDGAYSFFIGQTGTVYELRGWLWDQFANGADVVGEDNGPDKEWYTAMFLIGEGEKPTKAALDAFDGLIAEARDRGAGTEVLPHNAFKVKTCPGPDVTAHCWARNNQELPSEEDKIMSTDINDWYRLIAMDLGREYSAAVELWQRILRKEGLNIGKLDGIVGPLTEGAHQSWSSANAAAVTKRPTSWQWNQMMTKLTKPVDAEPVVVDTTRIEELEAALQDAEEARVALIAKILKARAALV